MALVDLSSLALILGAMARGPTRLPIVPGLGQAQLVRALMALGATIRDDGAGFWQVYGTGVGGWREPDRVLELGQIIGAVPLLAGALTTFPATFVLAADSTDGPVSVGTLRDSLERIGARLALSRGDHLPGALIGTSWPLPGCHDDLSPPDAAAILLAGLNTPGRTGVPASGLVGVIDLLHRFGAVTEVADGHVWVTGHPDLMGADLTV